MKNRFSIYALCAAFLLAAPVQAQTILCSLRPNSPDGAMPPDLIIDFTSASGATVAHGWQDGQRLHDVSVASNGNRQQMAFTLPFSVRSRVAMVHYTLTYFSNRQELRVAANAGAGFEGHFRGVYTCGPINR